MNDPLLALAKELAPSQGATAAQPNASISAGIGIFNGFNPDGSHSVTFNGASGIPSEPMNGFAPEVNQSLLLLTVGTQVWTLGAAAVPPPLPNVGQPEPIQIMGASRLFSGIGGPAGSSAFTQGQPAPQPGDYYFASDGAIPALWQLVGDGPTWTLIGGTGSGGYLSLTGPGQTATPGALVQAGGFSVGASILGVGPAPILLEAVGCGTGDGIGLVAINCGIDIGAAGPGADILMFAAGTCGSGGDIAIVSDGGSIVIGTFITPGPVAIEGEEIGLGATSGGIQFASSANGFFLFTADVEADLPTPLLDQTPAWGYTQDGNIYFYPTFGPWALVAGAVGGSITTITSADSSVTITNPTGPTVDLSVAGGGGVFPNFSGSGSPEGVQTAAVGKTYVDTNTGAIYFKFSGSGNTGWVTGIGSPIDLAGTPIPGIGFAASEFLAIVGDGTTATGVTITDTLALAGTGNGLVYETTGTDGGQDLRLTLGASGTEIWEWNSDGSTVMPGVFSYAGVGGPAFFQFAGDPNTHVTPNNAGDICIDTTTPEFYQNTSGTNTGWATLGGGGGGVTSFDTRTGAVTLVAADVESTFNAAGDIFVGTGSGTGTILPVGSNTEVLTVLGGVPVWAASGGGGGSIPTFIGSGSPEGAQTGSVGDTYQDTTTGALWDKLAGTATNTGWLGGVSWPVAASTLATQNLSTLAFTSTANWLSFNNALGADVPALAWGLQGDTWPEFVLMATSDDGIYLGDGTSDPTALGVGSAEIALQSGDLIFFNGTAGDEWRFNGDGSTVIPGLTVLDGVTISRFAGDPNGTVTATAIGDIVVDASTPGIWQAGAADNSHWVQVGTVTAAEIEATFTADGDIFVGTGTGTGTLLGIGTTGEVLTVVGGTAAWAAGGGGSFPSFTGAGNPEGTQTANVGQSYVDTTNGALYWFQGTNGTNTGWAAGVGEGGLFSGPLVPSVAIATGDIYIASGVGAVAMTDIGAIAGTGNQLQWVNVSGDGAQTLRVVLGSTGQYEWNWEMDGTTAFPGHITIDTTVDGGAATVFAFAGNPNTHISALAKGDLCVDVTTPAMWQATASGNSSWVIFATSALSFPDFVGSGSPEGVVTAAVGQAYEDTANGALYFKAAGTATDTGWAVGAGLATDFELTTGLTYGFGLGQSFISGSFNPTVLAASVGVVLISDAVTQGPGGFGNGLLWNTGGSSDGNQEVQIQLGSTTPYSWSFDANGSTNFPGPITIDGTVDGGFATFFAFAGDPNTHVTPNATGDLCVDVSTPAVWQASGTANTDWVNIIGGGSSFPDFTGSGSPTGSQVANVGQTYQDTTNGALYFKTSGTATNTGWVAGAGDAPGLVAGTDIGFGTDTSGDVFVVAAPDQTTFITDIAALAGTFNALEWVAGAADGDQILRLSLGPSGSTWNWFWDQSGTTEFPGPITIDESVDGGHATVFAFAGNPNTHITPNAIGDLCVDVSTPALWQNTSGTNTGWVVFGSSSISFPDFTGSGSPEAVQTANFGQWYQDTSASTSALYIYQGVSTGNTGWAQVGGIGPAPVATSAGGFGKDASNGQVQVLTGTSGVAVVSDVAAMESGGSGNCIEWIATGTDGEQVFQVLLGTGGAFGVTFQPDGQNTFFGPIGTDVQSVSGSFAMLGSESVILANGAITLPDPATWLNMQYFIKDNGAGTASVLPHAAETIDGAASILLSSPFEGVMVTNDGTNWFVIGQVAASIL